MKTSTAIKRIILPVMMLVVTAIAAWGQDVDSLKREFQKFYDVGLYRKAIGVGNRIIHDNPNCVTDTAYVDLITNLALCYECHFMPDSAIFYYSKAKDVLSESTKVDSSAVSKLLSNIGDCYFDKDLYDNAIYYYTQARETHPTFINGINLLKNIGDCYHNKGDYENSLAAYDEAQELKKRLRSIFLNNRLVQATNKLNDYSNYFLSDLKNTGLNYSLIYSVFFLNSPRIIQFCKDNDIPTDIIYQMMVDIKSSNYLYFLLSQEKDEQAFTNYLLHYKYLKQGDFSKSYSYYIKLLNRIHPFVIRELGTSTKKGRTLLWNNSFSREYLSVLPSIALEAQDSTAFGELYDKSTLFAKGMLLCADNEIQRLVNESNDINTTNSLYELQNLRSYFASILYQPEACPKKVAKKLKEKEQKLEKNVLTFLNGLKGYNNFMDNLQLTWEQVRDTLGTEDIAIEFLSFPKYGIDEVIYIALTVRPGYKSPNLIEICNESDLKALMDSAYTTTALSELIWKPLATELEGVRNIYFSPSGELHKIAIESMPHWVEKDSLMCNIYNIYRLSSTRELAMRRNAVEANGTELYGGIEYVCNIPDDVQSRQKHHETKKVGKKSSKKHTRGTDFGLRDDTKLEKLTWSGYEVDDIKKVLGDEAKKLKDCAATEESFKELSRKKVKNIHIATHGFYWNDSTAREKSVRFALLDNENLNEEDKAMTRTGLFFSGSQRIFDPNAEFPDSIDDGVLTAKEVADLDLRGLDLVALSACQTGLGDIAGSEGVFGLQRGFKKAGAQSIIMSLWPVHDEATRDMMVEFYKALKSDKSKREAFIIAQNFVKDKDHKGLYDYESKGLSPTRPHWAAFILLDALQ